MKILITGAAGFIGSNILRHFNDLGYSNIYIVDDIKNTLKWTNLLDLNFTDYCNIDKFYTSKISDDFDLIIHMGANSDTRENNFEKIYYENVHTSKLLAKYASERDIPFIYASSASVYGDGSRGFSDDNMLINTFEPLNLYGFSKILFDKWMLNQNFQNRWYGLRFFNVYGPGEEHKNLMSSFLYKSFKNIADKKPLELFKSANTNYEDGYQSRDFIYVKDINNVIEFIISNSIKPGFYNVGSGCSTTFLELAKVIQNEFDFYQKIHFIEMPVDLEKKYQYNTKSDNSKLYDSGYDKKFTDIEVGVNLYADYFENHKR